MRPSREDIENKLRDLLQMADIMNALIDRCERELNGLQPFLKPGFDLVDMTGLGIVAFQAGEIRGRVNELNSLWEEMA